jgi:hypothetical protein
MPLYFFHIRHPDQLVPDEEGMQFPDDDAARREGLESARELTADAVRRGETVTGWVIEIVDEGGRVLGSVGAQDAIIQQEPTRIAAKSN